MNTKTSALRSPALAALIACAFASAQAGAADSVTMTIDEGAPQRATLMPVVSVVGDVANPDAPTTWSIANTQPQAITLMPTVRVTAQSEALAVTLLPTITVNAPVESIAATTLPTVRVYADALPLAVAASTTRSQPSVASAMRVSRKPLDTTTIGSAPGPVLLVSPR